MIREDHSTSVGHDADNRTADAAAATRAPHIVGLGGTTREHSTSEQALRHVLALADVAGARTTLLSAPHLLLPLYGTATPDDPQVAHLLQVVASADALVIASPAYHGGISGLVKNALDYLEALRQRPEPYLDGRAVGCIISTLGLQAGGTALSSLRASVHALRGWPTPLGVVLDSSTPLFDADGEPVNPTDRERLLTVAAHVVHAARARAFASTSGIPPVQEIQRTLRQRSDA